MTQKPLSMTQAKAAFLKQANHYTRLGKPSNDDAKLLLNTLAGMLAVQTGQDNVRVRFDMHDVAPELAITRPRPTEQQWGINWPEEPDSYRYFAVKSEWEACCFAHLVRKWLEREFANAKYHYETYPVLWESEFGDHAKNLAEHYDSLKAEIDQMAEVFDYKKIGYADKNLKFYSFGEYFEELKLCVKKGEKKALYPVFAHIIKSGEHGIETPTLRTLRDDIDQLLSAVETQPATVAESATVEPVAIDCSLAPEGATHYRVRDGYTIWFKQDVGGLWGIWDREDAASEEDWLAIKGAPRLVSPIPRPVTIPTHPEPIKSLNISVRTQHLLLSAGILTIPDLANKTESELLDIKGLGEKSLAEILKAMNVEAMNLIQFVEFRQESEQVAK